MFFLSQKMKDFESNEIENPAFKSWKWMISEEETEDSELDDKELD